MQPPSQPQLACAQWSPTFAHAAIVCRLGATFNVTVDGHPALNLTSSDFLGLGNDPIVQVRGLGLWLT
jgi:hypothetical protein